MSEYGVMVAGAAGLVLVAFLFVGTLPRRRQSMYSTYILYSTYFLVRVLNSFSVRFTFGSGTYSRAGSLTGTLASLPSPTPSPSRTASTGIILPL